MLLLIFILFLLFWSLIRVFATALPFEDLDAELKAMIKESHRMLVALFSAHREALIFDAEREPYDLHFEADD